MTSGRAKTRTVLRCLRQGLVFLVLVFVCRSASAQAPVTFQYFYDSRGQLWKVVDSTGNVIEYIYDAVGNILEIRRSRAEGLAILGLTPNVGAPGTVVTIRGQGFVSDPALNLVRFNGMPATVTAATATSLTTSVPDAATTGPVTVTVGSVTATSSTPFTVTPAPVISSIQSAYALSGSTVTMAVRGVNLTGVTFRFEPALSGQSGITFPTVPEIDAAGTGATLQLAIGSSAAGQFVLVATAFGGASSGTTPTAGNTLTVFNLSPTGDADGDGLTNAEEASAGSNPLLVDTDGDGYPDPVELAYGGNPADSNSLPVLTLPRQASTLAWSVVNSIVPVPSLAPPGEASGLSFSVVNQIQPVPSLISPAEASGLPFSVANEVPPVPSLAPPSEASGLPFSVQNDR